MTKFDPELTTDEYHEQQDYEAWMESTSPDRFIERQIAYEARTRPFSAAWSYQDGGSITTIRPLYINTDPVLHTQQ